MALVALAVGAAVWFLRSPAPRQVTKVLVDVEPAEYLGQRASQDSGRRLDRTAITFSPDGRHLVYSAGDRKGHHLLQNKKR